MEVVSQSAKGRERRRTDVARLIYADLSSRAGRVEDRTRSHFSGKPAASARTTGAEEKEMKVFIYVKKNYSAQLQKFSR